MHTDTPATRTQFLATPQWGFAHLHEQPLRFEPRHDFLAVHFGAEADAVGTPCARPATPLRNLRTGNLP